MKQSELPADFFEMALGENPAAGYLRAEKQLVAQFAPHAVVACRFLDIHQYARLGHCELAAAEFPRPARFLHWGGERHDRLVPGYEQAVWDAVWREHALRVVQLRWHTDCGPDQRMFVVADTRALAEDFVLEVFRKTHAPGNAILVFSDGGWERSEAMYEAVQAASFDDLVLDGSLKARIRDDFRQFLAAGDRYRKLGIAWRRGAIFIGPPGNGKTHFVRALVKELNVSSLVVQSLSHNHFTAEQLWQEVFARARGLSPCVLVLEDLDALVENENRSFFLNQLDGFEQNDGLIVLATTNYPERIDPAILDRPSRFDRKYHFGLPACEQRLSFLSWWHGRLAEETGWTMESVEQVSRATDGFSFAYLKELVVSTIMSWMAVSSTPFEKVLAEQVKQLASQLSPSTLEGAVDRNGAAADPDVIEQG